ncbi:hypothetical protein CC1G_07884 [Coprinopsis cinerea okayama7|uniref:Uncharacterized protein n=1 Tax=Coprinopsis cinerea (strain Okayama-7 / 130 / ATCC MYA-4618 / FGSC 9003) TaxID=240176 RepID=A8P6K2_COPC7|nr:hypothetical protein CC1G_07884 [Coprinopsis cinerea okayama7\|eukprot:XP_001839169.2 hypothetical protein CC1G_07884 [Coprinopsis cinerea okayama7\
MDPYRKSTLYDLSGLKLQPGANRVNATPSSKVRPSQSSVRLQDTRGNWTARDAGGPSRVSKFYPRSSGSKSSEGAADDNGAVEDGLAEELDQLEPSSRNVAERQRQKGQKEGSGVDDASVEGAKRKDEGRKEGRPSKRLRFSEGLEYLVREAEEATRGGSPGPSDRLPLPTPELLQSIHVFAAQYYHEKGLLTNLSATARQERKKRKRKARAEKSGQAYQSGESDHENASTDSSSSSSSESETESAIQRRDSRRSERFRDMYRAFDGSALLALGILVQEFVKDNLRANIPAEWEGQTRESLGDEARDSDSDDREVEEDPIEPEDARSPSLPLDRSSLSPRETTVSD